MFFGYWQIYSINNAVFLKAKFENYICAIMMEKKKATNRELHLLFIDFKKAYDSVPLNKLWKT
jgi:hypothetical protein